MRAAGYIIVAVAIRFGSVWVDCWLPWTEFEPKPGLLEYARDRGRLFDDDAVCFLAVFVPDSYCGDGIPAADSGVEFAFSFMGKVIDVPLNVLHYPGGLVCSEAGSFV
ncbi:hypothetical protein [Mycobacterium sp. TY815]|uniref:hypothetical protein n=1 Tax=Mycobacterium sp. TY815 TaxID=3050581 RepID=UPI002741E448|nr:hypothetical protein [Mycobacterium sp. TY815]MDP7707394.1 hypothetical protein [Mycobacterium sp. TY815]